MECTTGRAILSHVTLQCRALLETIDDNNRPPELEDSEDEGDNEDEDGEDGEDDDEDEKDEDGLDDDEDADNYESGNDRAHVLANEAHHSGMYPLFLFCFSLSYIMFKF
jgi:hypothetical protein